MEYENALFIGGTADGERRSVLSGVSSTDVLVRPRSDEDGLHHADPGKSVDYRKERYTRQRLRGESADFVVYVAEGVDAIGALIDGYRSQK